MKRLGFASLSLALLGLSISCQAQHDTSRDALSITIIPPRTQGGSDVIDRGDGFQVVLTNHSSMPIRIWNKTCQPGYEALSFRVQEGDGTSWIMSKRVAPAESWQKAPLGTSTIAAGETLVIRVKPGDFFWGCPMWQAVPAPNSGKPIKFIAIFEIRASPATAAHAVWAGQITSQPIEALFVDPKLQTPLDYLSIDFPKRALEMMRADKTWLAKTDPMEQTPLHIAVRHGYTDVVRWLLANGADPNAVSYNRFTPLHGAGDPEIVKLLIEHGAPLNARDASNKSALENVASEYASLAGFRKCRERCDEKQKIAQMLLAAGAEYDLHSAIYLDDIARVRVLLADKEQVRDREAMRIAVMRGRTGIVKLLLDRGADPEDADYGGLPLSYFAIGHPAVLKVLLDAGANPKAVVDYRGDGQGPQGSTLLHEAANKGNIESIKLLLSRGADINVRDKIFGRTPLHVAARSNHTDVAELLLSHGALVNAKDDKGLTPLDSVNVDSDARDIQNLLRRYGGR
jgi:ankyrin repeat protein